MKNLTLYHLVGILCVTLVVLQIPHFAQAQSLSKPVQSQLSEGGKPKDTKELQSPLGESTCFCVITANSGISGKCDSANYDVILNLTGAVGLKVNNPRNAKKAQQCADACNQQAGAVSLTSLANTACSMGVANGSVLKAYDALGHCSGLGTAFGKYEVVDTIGTLTNTPEVSETVCTCPSGWKANATNVDGGVTSDGKCKKLAASPNGIPPFPPNGTQIGPWGFTWGDAFYAWGTPANGGAASCATTVVQAAVCEIN